MTIMRKILKVLRQILEAVTEDHLASYRARYPHA